MVRSKFDDYRVKLLIVAWLLGLLSLGTGDAYAVDEPCDGRVYPMERAVSFMTTFYKRLAGPRAEISIRGLTIFRQPVSLINDFDIRVGLPGAPSSGEVYVPQQRKGTTPEAVTGRFGFSNSCVLNVYHVFQVEGAPPSKHEAFLELVNSHFDWDDGRILKELKEAGARYTPEQREAFVRSLPLDALETLLGRIRVTRVEFQTAPEPPRSEESRADINWRVDLEAKAPGDRKRPYWLLFDPFDGGLEIISINGFQNAR